VSAHLADVFLQPDARKALAQPAPQWGNGSFLAADRIAEDVADFLFHAAAMAASAALKANFNTRFQVSDDELSNRTVTSIS